MRFRMRMAAWSVLTVILILSVLVAAAHWHLDGELRKDRWDRSHPQFPRWVIHGSYTDEEVQDILGELLKVWMWILFPLLAASVAGGYFIAIRSLRPVRRLNRELAALDSSSCARGVQLPGRDKELTELVRHINDLLQRVGRSYNEMAEFSASVAHELRTPLTLLRLRLESAAPELPAEVSEDLQGEIGRLSRLVERSLVMARAEGGKLERHILPVDLSALLADLREGYDLLSAEEGIQLDWQVEPGLQVDSDEELLRQILHNLIGNAIRHGRESARVAAHRTENPGRVVVLISNRIRDASTAQGGTGMGLRLVRAIARALEQTTFEASEQNGSFVVKLELAASQGGKPATGPAAAR